jgi:trigger factor
VWNAVERTYDVMQLHPAAQKEGHQVVATTMERIGATRVWLAIEVSGGRLEPAPAVLDSGGYAAPVEPSAGQKAALLAHVRAAAAEHGLVPLGRTEVRDIGYDADGALRFAALLDVRPEVVLPDLASVVVTVEPVTLDEHDVDEQIERLRERFATLADVPRPAIKGDVVHLDLSLRIGAVEVTGGSASGVPHEVGSERPLAGLDPALCGIGHLTVALDPSLVGLRVGETTTATTRLVGGAHAGQDAEASATVTKVAERILPNLDDAFAGTVLRARGGRGAALADLRAAVREDVMVARRDRRLRTVRDQVLARVATLAEVPVPDGLLAAEVEARNDWMHSEFRRLGTSVEAYLATTGITRECLDQDIRAAAAARIRGQFVLDALAEAEGLPVSQHEIQGMTCDRTRHGTADELAADVRRAKALVLLLQRVSLRDPDGNPVGLADLRRVS